MGNTNTVKNIIIDAIRDQTGKYSVPEKAAAEAAKVIINQTNNEPWFQSYVTLGSLGSIITAVGTIVTELSGQSPDLATLGPSIAVLLTAGVALWGRWRAKKPLGA